MPAKTILGIIPGLQATSVMTMNIPKKFPKKISAKPVKNILKNGVGTLVGISLIKPTAKMISKI